MTRYWFAYTGESVVFGHGRAIRHVISDPALLQNWLATADKHYSSSASKEAFVAAMLAPLAMQDMGSSPPTAKPFSSVGQVMALFDTVDIDQAAVNIFNGRITSAYATEDPADIAARVTQELSDGQLLLLPRDADRLHTLEILAMLPGIVVFLLARTKAQSKAFSHYLRHGIPPVITHDDSAAMAALRPVFRTWEREARLTHDITKERFYASDTKIFAPDDLPPLLSAIEALMRQVERMTQEAADAHMTAFAAQMREKFGADEIVLDEPYLQQTLAFLSLKFLIKLERLMQKLERGAEDEDYHTDIFDFDEPLVLQLQQRLSLETARHQIVAKQELDKTRQQAFGVKKYVWRASIDACEICAPLDGQVFSWGDGSEPGSTHENCQCSAEPLADDADYPDKIEPVYPLETLLAILVGGGIAWKIGKDIITRTEQAPTQQPKPSEKPATGNPIGERPRNVPKNWEKLPSKKKDGVKYVDPKNKGNDIRIQKGNPNSQYPNQRDDYVKWKKDGQWLDKNGEPIPGKDPGKSPDAHIPIEEFNFDLEIFK